MDTLGHLRLNAFLDLMKELNRNHFTQILFWFLFQQSLQKVTPFHNRLCVLLLMNNGLAFCEKSRIKRGSLNRTTIVRIRESSNWIRVKDSSQSQHQVTNLVF
jgi:hypothetical protein